MTAVLEVLGAEGPALQHGMVGQHATMVSLLRQASQAARLPLPVIISGPTGSGKECVAEAIHRLAAPRGRLVVVNVTTIPESLVDSELFGSVRGAFSGAQDRAGLVEAAQSGTLVLDEASDLPVTVQARLLRVVEPSTFRRLGSPQERAASFRLMLTTQDDPAALVAARRWRADFYHRVAGTVLRVPALKDRATDIPELVAHFAARAGLEGIRGSFEPLLRLEWPGNVRQLQRLVLAAAGRGPVLSLGDLHEAALAESRLLAATPRAELCTLAEASARHIQKVWHSCAGDAPRAAKILGLSRSQLYRRLAATRPCDVDVGNG